MAPRNSAEPSPRVQVPSASADQPAWGKVGAIAAIGFVIGVAWPKVLGVRLGPSVPEAAASGSASAPGAATTSPPAAPAPVPGRASQTPIGPAPPAPSVTRAPEVPVAAAVPAASAGESSAAASSVSIGNGTISSCKTSSGETLKSADCGSLPGLDGMVIPRLRHLSDCPGAAGASGRLRLVLRADFGRGAIGVDAAHGTSMPGADAVVSCAREALHGIGIASIAHENTRYNVGYSVTFAPGQAQRSPAVSASERATAAPAAAAAPTEPATGDGTAQVTWKVALVHDAPATGKVVARLPRGTAVHVGRASDGWVPVKYGENFASDGWVYHEAIGR